MIKYVRVEKKFLERCYSFINEVAIRDLKVGRNDDYAQARQILNNLIKILDTG